MHHTKGCGADSMLQRRVLVSESELYLVKIDFAKFDLAFRISRRF